MKFDNKIVDKVAKVARIKLSESEKKKFAKDLESITRAFSILDEINVGGTGFDLQPVELPQHFHLDRVEKCLTREEALSNTKHKSGGYFKGPKVK